MYPGIELRLLRYAVAVAEELNFTRAAERLHVSQPSLSKQVRELEEVLGTQLFIRTKRDVSLTDAGNLFVEEARKALRHSEQARECRPFYASRHASPYWLLPVRQSRPDYGGSGTLGTAVPNGNLSMKSYFTRHQLSKLRDGKLDAALVILPVNDDDLVIEPLLSESLLVALPDGHSLARNRTVALSDLREMPAISFPQKTPPRGFPAIVGQLRSRWTDTEYCA